MGLFFSAKVNASIAAMKIPPTAIPAAIRKRGQDIGKNEKLTPQETALVIVAARYGVGYPVDSDVPLAVQIWTDDRKIHPEHPLVMDALMTLSLY